MELFKQVMELFHPLPDLWTKNLFYEMSLILTKEFLIDFQNRKWNYPNRKWNYLNRKWNYFTHFQTSDQKTSFTKCFSFLPRSSKLILKQEMESFKQEMALFLPLPVLSSKNFFNKNFLISTQEFKIDFQNRNRNHLNRKRSFIIIFKNKKWNYLNRKWNYFSYFQSSDRKTYFTKCLSFSPRSS